MGKSIRNFAACDVVLGSSPRWPGRIAIHTFVDTLI